MDRRVVITGMGQITSFGNDLEKFWEDIKNGKNGITRVENFDVTDYSTTVCSGNKRF
jgi:3-oxoacyl-[acyl-carrier-protein] synthase II